MRPHTSRTFVRLLCAALCTFMFLVPASRPAFAAATVIVVNLDGPNEGFNDPTPAAPVGGNTGTTKGQQRLIAFQHAASIWGATIDSPVTIIVNSNFDSLGANVLGSAGTTQVFAFGNVGDSVGLGPGFYPGVEFANTWYGNALIDKRTGVDINGGAADIRARFSSDFNFYLGLDNNHGALNDLVTVVLHELGHGLNFQSFVNSSTGANFGGLTDIYARHLIDDTTGKHWDEMTDAERAASATRFGHLIWDGANVTADVPQVLKLGSPEVRVLTPTSIAGVRQFGTAAFGPIVGNPNVSTAVVAAVDAANAAGPATTDGCTAFTNAADVVGKIVFVERGTCGFAVKARNATNAGAAAVVIYNNVANVNAAPPGMADDGVNGAFVTIPTVSLTRADGLAILAQPASARIGVDPTIRAGADANNRARLYAPFPVSAGSSVSHYDTTAFKNLLMEPAINADLTHKLTAPDDLTLELLRDVGWFADKDLDGVADGGDCEASSNLSPTIVIGGENTGVANFLFSTGCTVSDLIAHIADDAKNHGQFVSGVSHLTNDLKQQGLITGAEKGAIQSAAAHAK